MDIQPYMVPLLVAAGLAATGSAASIAMRSPRTSPSPTLEPDGQLNIFVLGYPQSGKTAVLTAMFRTLSRDQRHGITVRTDSDQHDQLNDLASRFEDTNAVLPHASPPDRVDEYTFAFEVHTGVDQQADQPPLTFSCLDYSGEQVTDAHRPPGMEPHLAQRLAQADVVVGLIDGAKIAAMMDSGATPDDLALSELRDLSRLLDKHKDKVIQLVVTKWDLLAGRWTHEEVVNWLTQRFRRFKDLREHRRASPVWIIPTSAFGLNEFMKETPQGRIRRDPAKDWEPFLADAPIACAVNEILGHGIHRLTGPGGDPPREFAPDSVSPFFAWAVKILGLVTISTDSAGNVQFALNPDALSSYQSLISTASSQPTGPATSSRALQLVLRHCRSIADAVERDYPRARS